MSCHIWFAIGSVMVVVGIMIMVISHAECLK